MHELRGGRPDDAASVVDGITPLNDVNRVEVIDQNGRSFTRYGVSGGVEIAIQDDGRTLKVFLGHSNWKLERNEPEE